jgi:hypothetical protein
MAVIRSSGLTRLSHICLFDPSSQNVDAINPRPLGFDRDLMGNGCSVTCTRCRHLLIRGWVRRAYRRA